MKYETRAQSSFTFLFFKIDNSCKYFQYCIKKKMQQNWMISEFKKKPL